MSGNPYQENGAAEQPLVSVILPTYKRPNLLPRAIQSVLGQTYRNLELIVVDDASPDNTESVVRQFDDPRLRYIRLPVNRHAAAARNIGIKESRGEFVAFLDDDDMWLVQKLEKQVKALQAASSDVGWCLSGHIRIETNRSRYFGGDFYIRQLDYANGIGTGGPEWYLIATPGWFVRRRVLDQAGHFDERIRSWDDWELGLRLTQVCKKIVVDEPLWVQDMVHGGGLTKNEHARSKDMRIIMQEHGHIWAKNRRVTARHFYTIGRGENLFEPKPAGRDSLYKSFKVWPFSWKTNLAILLSYANQDLMRDLTRRIRQIKT